jgi:AraC-like DNA-binding protein
VKDGSDDRYELISLIELKFEISTMFNYVLPQNPLLQKHIEYVLFAREEKVDAVKKYIVFPNAGSALIFYSNSHFEALGGAKFISSYRRGANGVLLHINRMDPVEIIEKGRQEYTAVVFRPCGLNYFLQSSLQDLQGRQDPSFIRFSGAHDFFNRFSETFAGITPLKKLAVLEEFFIDHYSSNKLDRFNALVNELSDVDATSTLALIAKGHGFSEKTVTRLFEKHIRLGPAEFRKIVRFRASVKTKLSSSHGSFNDVALTNNYCDLSYMIKTYKKLTGNTAVDFFTSVIAAADNRYIYQPV